jgi:hypothetical protein
MHIIFVLNEVKQKETFSEWFLSLFWTHCSKGNATDIYKQAWWESKVLPNRGQKLNSTVHYIIFDHNDQF